MKLKLNRSLKDLKMQHHKFNEQSSITKNNINIILSPTSAINLDNISKQLKDYQQADNKKDQAQMIKHNYSQTRLDIPAIKYIPISSKNCDYLSKKDRIVYINQGKIKQNQNVATTPFDIEKLLKNQYQIKPLTPVNRNLTIEQPKRPKILNKQKQLSFQQQFKLGKVLGKGRFGNVFQAQHKMTNFLVAVKQISLTRVNYKLVERLTCQIKIQLFIKHENCLELYRYYKQVLELGQSSLFDKLRQKKYFTEGQTAYYISQTIKALIYLHNNNIIHRDLKPENIVLINNVVKLADFGWSIYIGNNSKRTTFCGTLDYVSPQIVLGSQYGKMVDVWSVGVLCYELSTGHAPFQSSKSRQQTYKKIVNVDIKFPKYLSEEVKDFIMKLLIKNPDHRINLQDALMHPWIKKYSIK